LGVELGLGDLKYTEFLVNLLGDYLVGLLGIGHGSKYIFDVEKNMIVTRVTFRRI
jgi:hypothetical protein